MSIMNMPGTYGHGKFRSARMHDIQRPVVLRLVSATPLLPAGSDHPPDSPRKTHDTLRETRCENLSLGGGGNLPVRLVAGTSLGTSFFQIGGGTLSRSGRRARCPAASKLPPRSRSISEDSRGRRWTTSSGKHCCINALASEVARHQQFRKFADFKFNSRRLHQFKAKVL